MSPGPDWQRLLIWNGIVIGLFLISYVVNIGLSRRCHSP
jgi:hypothetical protein